MARIEVCRIVLAWDTKQQAKRWWEARLVSSSGEQVINRVDFWDEIYRSDAGYVYGSIMKDFLTFNAGNDKKQRRSTETHDNAHARLIADLLQDGWEPTATDQWGRINMLKRSV